LPPPLLPPPPPPPPTDGEVGTLPSWLEDCCPPPPPPPREVGTLPSEVVGTLLAAFEDCLPRVLERVEGPAIEGILKGELCPTDVLGLALRTAGSADEALLNGGLGAPSTGLHSRLESSRIWKERCGSERGVVEVRNRMVIGTAFRKFIYASDLYLRQIPAYSKNDYISMLGSEFLRRARECVENTADYGSEYSTKEGFTSNKEREEKKQRVATSKKSFGPACINDYNNTNSHASREIHYYKSTAMAHETFLLRRTHQSVCWWTRL
jgi:hypothetical protein